jgi:plasmid stabilization system protein ParE
MGRRKVIVKQSAADAIAAIAWFIESKGMVATAEKFADDAYDFFVKMSDFRKSYPPCREPHRYAEGYKCLSYKKKYTIVFLEFDEEIIVCEFISSKLIYW